MKRPEVRITILNNSILVLVVLAIVMSVLIIKATPDFSKRIGFHVDPPINSTISDNVETPVIVIPTILTVNNNNFSIDYDIPLTKQGANTVRIPVLTYHHVGPVPNKAGVRDYFVSPEIFEQQLQYLQQKNYAVLTPSEFYKQLASGQNPTQKSVMLTFDDGNYDNYQYAFPLLKKYGFPGVFYVPSNKGGIDRTKLKEMSDAGMIIDPHGKTHLLLSKVTDSKLLYDEIVNSKLIIQNITGKTSDSFCYPGCEYNGSVVSTIRNNGYLVAFSCGKSIDHKIGNRFVLSRMHVYDDISHFKNILSGVSYYPY